MEQSSSRGGDEEAKLLRAHVRDLVALLTLPLLWREREPADICSSLVETLRSLLRVELAYVRVECHQDGSTLEARSRSDSPALEPAFEAAIEAWRASGAGAAPRPARLSIGAIWTSGVAGELEGDRVLVLVGASREGFPTQVDNALLRAATDQATLSIRAARLLAKERAARAQAELHASQLRGLNEASLAMNSEAPVEEILKVVTEKARAVVGAHQALTSLTIDPSGEQSIRAIALSEAYAARAGYDASARDSGMRSVVCNTNRPMRLTDAELDAHPERRRDGEERREERTSGGWVAAPLSGRDGRNVGMIQLFDKETGDFSEGDQAILVQLAQVASVALENARLNAERADLLAREQAARAEAESANRLKDDFLATISHELRTPLNAMLGWVTMLRAGSLPPERRDRALETIERNARAQAQLVDDLLDVSRIINGKLKLDLEPVDADSIVEVALESMRPSAEAKGVQLDLSLGRAGVVLADPARLQQIVLNLLSNAVKFTPRGGRVGVSVEGVESSVMIRVTDTGRGISPEFLPHVFERFRQFDGTTARAHGGLGLGLAIVRHLVELHGGAVAAESEGEGHGATFTVRLPVAVLTRARPSAPSADADADLTFAPELEGLHVLALDDEEDAREVLRSLLQGCHMRVTTAASTADALAVVMADRPDIIVSDIGMAGQDGFAFIAQVRSLPPEEGGRTPAIALTALTRAEDRTRILRAGFNSHVPKPLEAAELVATLAAIWGNRSRP